MNRVSSPGINQPVYALRFVLLPSPVADLVFEAATTITLKFRYVAGVDPRALIPAYKSQEFESFKDGTLSRLGLMDWEARTWAGGISPDAAISGPGRVPPKHPARLGLHLKNNNFQAGDALFTTHAASAASAVLGVIGVPLVASTEEIGESDMTKNTQIPDSRIIWPPEHSPASSRVFAQNIIDIAATPETVWSLLIDCVKWPSWYKHCSDVSVLKGGPLLSANSQFRFKTLGFTLNRKL
jgi:hypothetical protein